MDEKEFALFAKAWLILGYAFCDENGAEPDWMKAVLDDENAMKKEKSA